MDRSSDLSIFVARVSVFSTFIFHIFSIKHFSYLVHTYLQLPADLYWYLARRLKFRHKQALSPRIRPTGYMSVSCSKWAIHKTERIQMTVGEATARLQFREAINNFARNFKWSGFTFKVLITKKNRDIPAPIIQTSTAEFLLVPAFAGLRVLVSFPTILRPCSFLIQQSPDVPNIHFS